MRKFENSRGTFSEPQLLATLLNDNAEMLMLHKLKMMFVKLCAPTDMHAYIDVFALKNLVTC